MSIEDERIREIARSIDAQRQAEVVGRAALEQSRVTEVALNMQVSQERATQVRSLCGHFAVWASSNGISYNSPSLLAPGWLLGHYEGSPFWSYSGNGMQDSGGSAVSLLVRRSGSIHEIVVRDAYKKGESRHHLLSRAAKLDMVPIETIHTSIAQFSVKHNVPWR